MKLYQEFKKRNPQFRLADFNPAEEDCFREMQLGQGESASLKERIYAGKRLLTLTGDEELHEKLLENQIYSALIVSHMSEERFVRKYSRRLGLPEGKARIMHRRAVGKHTQLLHMVAGLKTTAGSHAYLSSRSNTLGTDAAEYFEKLPDYEELFGTEEFCSCGQCKSIFGPAAYFVDLMRIIHQYITGVNEIPEGLKLGERRPDLELLPLTCANTNKLVPYVQIISERLYDAAATFMSDDPDKAIASMKYPFHLPLCLPIEQIRSALAQVSLELSDIYRVWRLPEDVVWRERAGLLPGEYRFFTEPLKKGELPEYFGMQEESELSGLEETKKFLQVVEMTETELDKLLYQNLTQAEKQAGAASGFYINQGLSDGQWIYEEGGRLLNIQGGLDRLNRLIRMSRKLNVEYGLLDWLLYVLQDKEKVPAEVNSEVFMEICRMKELAGSLGISMTELGVFRTDMKLFGQDVDGKNHFDSVYNNKSLYQHKYYRPDKNPVLTWMPGENQELTGYLCACLGLTEKELLWLKERYLGAEPVDLTVKNLSLLYRLAEMLRLLKMESGQYGIFMELLGMEGKKYFSAEELSFIFRINTVMQEIGCHVYFMDYFLRGVNSSYVSSLYPPKVQEGLMEYLCSKGYTKETTEIENKVLEDISIYLDLPEELLNPAMRISMQACAPLPVEKWTEIFTTFRREDGEPVFKKEAQNIIELVSRWVRFCRTGGITGAVLNNIAAYPRQYGMDDTFTCGIRTACGILGWASFLKSSGFDYDSIFQAVEARERVDMDSAALYLAQATGWPKEDILWTAPDDDRTEIFFWVHDIGERIRIISKTGAGEYTIGMLLSTATDKDFDSLQHTADNLTDRLKNVYGNLWEQVEEALKKRLEAARRDGLLDIIRLRLHQKYSEINTFDDVYKYYLIDVEMDEDTSISYVKEGINAVQLYLQRCRMRMEYYVRKVDIREAWWTWIMNYREWEANRKIFAYPENYLLPSIRSGRTGLFRNMESALLQADVSKGYMQEQYCRYLDDFSELSQVTPVEIYFTEESCYLFGRSNEQDGSFYYCERKNGEGYGEWKKIEVLIHSDMITPVYIFNRLYLFWAEKKCVTENSVEGKSGDISSVSAKAYTVTVCYTCMNMQGKWMTPGKLVEDKLVYYESEKENLTSKFPQLRGVYDMEALSWKKVQVYQIPMQDGEKEGLLVVYGNFLNNTGIRAEVPLPSGSDYRRVFTEHIRELFSMYNTMLETGMSGYLAAGFSCMYDEDLKVLAGNRYYVLDTYTASKWNRISVRPFIRSFGGTSAGVAMTGAPLADRSRMAAEPDFQGKALNQNSFTSDRITAQQSHTIFRNLKAAGLITGENMADTHRILNVDVGQALLYCMSEAKIPGDILPEIQEQLFRAAGGWCILGNTGQQPEIIPAGNLNGGFLIHTDSETFYLYPYREAVVQPGKDRPKIGQDYFTSDDISSGLSEKIYEQYRMYGIVDEDGSVDIELLSVLDYSLILGNMMLQKKLTAEQACQANVRLLTVPPSYTLKIEENPKRHILADGLQLKRMPAVPQALTALGYNMTDSGNCIHILKEKGVLDEDGFLEEAYQEEETLTTACKKALGERCKPELCNFLLGYPRIQEDFFVDDFVSAQLSAELVNVFREYGVADKAGRVDLKLLAVSSGIPLDNMVLQGKIPQSMVPQIYRKLFDAPVPVCVKYRSKEALTLLSDGLMYTMERMSNQSIKGLKQRVYLQGTDSLLCLEAQEIPVIPVIPADRLKPDYRRVVQPDALDGAQPDFSGLYGEYNWEIFYHIPMLIADKLKAGLQNREAAAWYEYVFRPANEERLVKKDTFWKESGRRISAEQSAEILKRLKEHQITDGEGRVNNGFRADTELSFLSPLLDEEQISYVRNVLLNYICAGQAGYYWNFRPFRKHTMQNIIADLTSEAAIRKYNDTPFDPHAIARLRIGAYEKYTFMEYLDNLIQWGDKEFTRFTWESITTATMLYVTAYSMLGQKPKKKASGEEDEPRNYRYFYEKYEGDIPQFLLEIENLLSGPEQFDLCPAVELKQEDISLYFGIPENEKLLSYWDIIEDRLYKIRHSMDIQGNKRALALFEPPADTAALARMAAADGNTVMLSADRAGNTLYHFPFLLDRAKYYASTLAQTGGLLLSALEKADGESFMILSNTQERLILDMTTSIKKVQEEELGKSLEAMERSRKAAEERETYYTKLLETGISEAELQSIDEARTATALNASAQVIKSASAIGYAVPQVGSPFAMTYGGQQIGNVMTATAGVLDILSSIYGSYSQQTAVMAGYERREAEWVLQKNLAVYDKEGAQMQIEAVKKRLEAARADSRIHQKLIAQKKEVYEFLSGKFTGRQLYQWMSGRLSALMWQAYQMTLKLALEAQQAYQVELDCEDSFITCQYWDGGKKGLLSGEALLLSLNEMEISYFRKNVRRFEIEKNISLRESMPEALKALKEKGECNFTFTERMFDEDYPGHYARKIKSVSLTIPAVIAPYETLNAVLTQNSNVLVSKPDFTTVRYLLNNFTGDRGTGLLENWYAHQKIAVSRGIEDSGMFMLNFQGEKYLPFEGTGAVSGWSLEMPRPGNHFDYDSISDVIINVKYTALEDGQLGAQVRELVWK